MKIRSIYQINKRKKKADRKKNCLQQSQIRPPPIETITVVACGDLDNSNMRRIKWRN